MAGSSTAEVCRLLVVGPTSRVDLSVPTHVPLADLMPAMLRSLGPDLADRGLEHSGWVVQRLGEPPLDEDLCVADHDLLDGDAVHLRPRSDQIPPLDFDDLIDGVATGMRARSGRWRIRTNRAAAMVVLALLLLAGLAMPLLGALDGPPGAGGGEDWGSGVPLAAGGAPLLLGAAVAAGLFLRERLVGGLLGAAAVGFAVEAVLLTLTAAPAGATPSGPVRLAVGAGVSVVVALPLLAAVAERRLALPIGLAVLTAALGAVTAAALVALAGLSWTHTAAILAVALAAGRPLVPLTAFRLARMALPRLPVEPDELQDDIDPEPGPVVLARTAAADRYMTALHGAAGVACAAALIRLAGAPGWLPATLVVLVALAGALAARPMTSGWHRIALCLPALAGLLALLLDLAARAGGTAGAGVVLAVTLLLALAAAVGAHVLPRRRLTPRWGRVGDWVHVTALVLAVPLVICLLGGIGLVRSRIG
ncbi:type VII secretion integral membrane protein EccD [Frankia sp. AgB32]|uniref:type VII secretion integral membrane protein EccD n=1 Tax=Frankia sp. AgB32 TaxID=631119 RepID=UPI00200DF5D6|nr:type VII secretion integral membrane protein EccD [Frankia sp. AgB32]MCK9897011.1 type VII secretion integral membrane protein EccD [Frankia sp. AgB32]